jgi:Ser-tRNA(Ala) deacylase AlaX
MTRRLYWEEPARKTALAEVTSRRGGGFLLDRTLYHASLPSYHHAQPCDRGHVLAEGHKLKIHKVSWRGGELVHLTGGPLPAPGAKAQLHLDAPRRLVQARAHTLMHLLLQALAEARATLLESPDVVGGGEVRARARFREAPAEAWGRVVAGVGRRVEARDAVEATWTPRDEAQRAPLTPQAVPLDAVAPGEPTLRLVRIGENLLPCDAPLVERSSDVGAFRAAPPQVASDGSARLRLKTS